MLVMPVRSWLAVSREAMVAVNSALRMKQRKEKASTMTEPALENATISRACVNRPSASQTSMTPDSASPCRFCGASGPMREKVGVRPGCKAFEA